MRNSLSGSPTGTATSAGATRAQGVYGPQMSDQGTDESPTSATSLGAWCSEATARGSHSSPTSTAFRP